MLARYKEAINWLNDQPFQYFLLWKGGDVPTEHSIPQNVGDEIILYGLHAPLHLLTCVVGLVCWCHPHLSQRERASLVLSCALLFFSPSRSVRLPFCWLLC